MAIISIMISKDNVKNVCLYSVCREIKPGEKKSGGE